MRFFWGGHFEFFKSAILKFFLLHLCEKSSPFIWGNIFFCTMDGFSRILEKKLCHLLCTRQYYDPRANLWNESAKKLKVISFEIRYWLVVCFFLFQFLLKNRKLLVAFTFSIDWNPIYLDGFLSSPIACVACERTELLKTEITVPKWSSFSSWANLEKNEVPMVCIST